MYVSQLIVFVYRSSKMRTIKEAHIEWYEAGAQRERSLARLLDLGSRYMKMIIDKISFKKEGLPSSECFNCLVRHLGTFFGTQ